jgi:serine/threonine protein kinase
MHAPEVPGLVLSRQINDVRAGQWRGPGDGPPGSLHRDPTAPGRGVAAVRWPAAHGVMTVDEVYLGRRTSDGLEVAVKLYARPLRGSRDQLRFEQEVSALKSLLGLPHVLAPLGSGVVDGRAFVVSPFCPSGSLDDHLGTVGRFTPIEVRRIGGKIAGGLARAHQLGIVHRRVKPANVLIDADGEPQLADFGLVSLTLADGGALTPDGSRAFSAPEAYLPELMSVSSDVYSLGATLYALLAGWSPRTDDPLASFVDGDSVADLPHVPPALMRVLRLAIAMDPQDRYPDMSLLADALREED